MTSYPKFEDNDYFAYDQNEQVGVLINDKDKQYKKYVITSIPFPERDNEDIDQFYSIDHFNFENNKKTQEQSILVPSQSQDQAYITPIQSTNIINTLDEPVLDTIKRDLSSILTKLTFVLSINLTNLTTQQKKSMVEWDLWGPFLICVLFGISLSFQSNSSSKSVFAVIFMIVLIGSFIVTINAKLLRGKIICILGYCIAPIALASLIIIITKKILPFFIIQLIIGLLAFAWSSLASIGFMAELVDQKKKILSVYPIILFYLFLSWFVVVS